jgi:hypothetical protein
MAEEIRAEMVTDVLTVPMAEREHDLIAVVE